MSASVYTSDHAFLPNLPGYRANTSRAGPKKSQFTLVKGQVFIKDEYLPTITYDGSDDQSTMTFGTTLTKLKKNTMQETITLTFQAYFEENPIDNAGRAPQIRKCNIFFFADDGTLKIVEKPQVNSGVSQGTLVRRAVIPKQDGTAITAEDLKIGEDLVVYGRRFRIVDCDMATRGWLRSNVASWNDGDSLTIPRDSHEEYRRSLEPGSSNDTWGKFFARKNDSKTFVEASLGKSVNNLGREGFIRFGNKTLKFRCVWDNTANLYGDVMDFALQYYLSDDTVEITSAGGGKGDPKMKLLKRSKLPRDFQNTMILGERPQAAAYFHWSDLFIGMELEVFGRKLQVVDADVNTRDFYDMYECSLGPAIFQPAPEVVVHKREIPPPTGFGSEEDSLRSVNGSLMPGPAPVKKLGESKILSFFASLLSGGIDDVDRRFVISFYVQDNTLKVVEPPVRNSGFSGGLFLSRREVQKEGAGIALVTEKDLYVGCRLRILKHEFLLLDSNEGTLKWMEDKGLPRSSFYKIVDKLRSHWARAAHDGSLVERFRQIESEPGRVTKEAFSQLLSSYGLLGNDPAQVSEHEVITILRANGNRQPHFNYTKVIEQIVRPTDEFK